MDADPSIRMQCSTCGEYARGKESYLSRKIKCPVCGCVVCFVRAKTPPTPSHALSQDVLSTDSTHPNKNVAVRPSGLTPYSARLVLASWIAGGGLLVMTVSPLSRWITFGNGGITGIVGDGKYFFGVSVIATAMYAISALRRKWLTPVLLGVQAWGTIAACWTGSLVWKIGTLVETTEVKGNVFATLLATQVGPGAGPIADKVNTEAAASFTVDRAAPPLAAVPAPAG